MRDIERTRRASRQFHTVVANTPAGDIAEFWRTVRERMRLAAQPLRTGTGRVES